MLINELLFLEKMPSKTFIAKEQHHILGFKTRKDKIILLFCCNVASHMIKPGLIYKASNPRAIKHCDDKSLPVHWMHNKKALTARNLFLYWFHRCFITETKRYLSALDLEFRVLLILDNVTGLWPHCVKSKSTFLLANEDLHAVHMTVALAHLLDGDDELLVEITGSTDEENDADEDSAINVTEELTLEGLAEILHTLKQRDLEIAVEPYQ
ncbi:Tigger transposable element-derived protein 1 [Trichinella pseudospiralis]|uniref:Tigger transposable element-derived protein 1 n=1 Tax=Trichinella pseudospiralis TaxID=6337 RepID=A0A0V1E4M1_TRIPS|nr:Tigger transposable element-derived protein 1 [Trichinella pseudospiralis]